MYSNSFAQIFPASTIEHIIMEESGHLTLLIHVTDSFLEQRQFDIGFQFKEMWTRHENYASMFEQVQERED
jgi:hypothetical protein